MPTRYPASSRRANSWIDSSKPLVGLSFRNANLARRGGLEPSGSALERARR